jgi:hypothetical protein
VLAQQSAQTGAQIQAVYGGIATEDNAIRPFRVHVPQEALVDRSRRIAATRWADKEVILNGSFVYFW